MVRPYPEKGIYQSDRSRLGRIGSIRGPRSRSVSPTVEHASLGEKDSACHVNHKLSVDRSNEWDTGGETQICCCRARYADKSWHV